MEMRLVQNLDSYWVCRRGWMKVEVMADQWVVV
jgi:hypothetical protein